MRPSATVAVGMATFRRPEYLSRLIPRIIEQIEEASSDGSIEYRQFKVIVVDNDPLGSGQEAAEVTGDARVRYVIEPEPGISSARNRILKEAEDCDVLVIIDDDEVPHPRWLTNLLRTYDEYGADAVSGPVRPVFEGGADPWITASGTYLEQQREGLETGAVLRRAATNNLLLNMRRIRSLGLVFDYRFGLTGGEDSLFTGQLAKAGGCIVWCAEAVVDDQVPAERNNRGFNLRRRFATSATNVKVEQMLLPSGAARVRGWCRWVVIGVGQVVKGALMTLGGWMGRALVTRARGERRVASGLGVLAGCLGCAAAPYARKAEKE